MENPTVCAWVSLGSFAALTLSGCTAIRDNAADSAKKPVRDQPRPRIGSRIGIGVAAGLVSHLNY